MFKTGGWRYSDRATGNRKSKNILRKTFRDCLAKEYYAAFFFASDINNDIKTTTTTTR
jgi:hypothetical protein